MGVRGNFLMEMLYFKVMNISTTNTCTNCDNLGTSFNCNIHRVKVDLNNTCSSHKIKFSINSKSSCSNCSAADTKDCSHPKQAAKDMLCFDWSNETREAWIGRLHCNWRLPWKPVIVPESFHLGACWFWIKRFGRLSRSFRADEVWKQFDWTRVI